MDGDAKSTEPFSDKIATEINQIAETAVRGQQEKIDEHEAGMLALKTKQIEMALAFAATEEAKRQAVERIEKDYQDRKKERAVLAVQNAQIELSQRAISAAADVRRLENVARDAEEVKAIASNFNDQDNKRKQREREEAKARYNALKAAADLVILSEKLDTQNRTRVDRPTEIPPIKECCQLSNLDDTTFLSLCSVLLCPYPGLCVVQKYLMDSLHIERTGPSGRNWDILWDQFGFAGIGLATCCLGLAWNRERITDETISRKGNFCLDCGYFCCCLGCIPMMRDEMFVFPIKPKLQKKFREGLFTCFDMRKVKRGWNCLGCFSAVFCPVPSICLIQACTIVEVEEVLRSVTGSPLEKNEKNALMIKYFLYGCLGCCIGLALNRSKIADGIGADEHCGRDCLLYMCCCQCLAVQECYSISEMRYPPQVSSETETS